MWRPCFAASGNYQQLYLDYAHIASAFTGWNLTELRKMSRRERHYWCEIAARKLGMEKRDDDDA